MIRIASVLPATFKFTKAVVPEVWKPVASLDGYSASSEGRIRNNATGRILRPCRRPDGYRQIGVGGRRILAHRAIAEAFHGACPDGMEVDHRNGAKADNRPDNLDYVSHRTNLQRAAARGQLARGERNHNSKLHPEAAREIRDAHIRHGDLTRFARKYGVSVPAVRQVRLGKAWAWVS